MATIKDVAALSGVSVTTVSRVLNKRGYISEDTYKKVYDAMAELNYQPNQLARSLSKQKTNFIGLLVPDVSHPFFAEMTHLLEISLFNHGYKLILCNTQRNDMREQSYLDMLRQNKVDGAIVATHYLQTSDYKDLSLPLVAMDVFLDESIPSVHSNHIRGGKLAARPFIDGNAHCVLQIRGDSDIKSPAWMRHSVFADELLEHNIECIDYELKADEFDISSYCKIIQEQLDSHPEIDGVFSTDIVVSYAIKYILEKGKKIPDDYIIVGYDGVDISNYVYPSLSYVRQPFEKLADTIVDVLLRKINGENLTDDVVVNDVRFIKGNTTR